MVRRSVAIALGIICIVLVAGLAGAISILNEENASLNSQVTYLQSQVSDLNTISILNKTMIWVNNQTVSLQPNTYTSWEFRAHYAGYVVVALWQSTNSHAYVREIYNILWIQVDPTDSSGPVNYDNQINFGNFTNVWVWAVFPALPTLGLHDGLEIRVGNNDTVGTIGNVTITFYY